MTSWLEIGLSNALMATGLALVAWVVTRFCRHPKVVFTVWLLVLAKLLVPPLVGLPFPTLLPPTESPATSVGALRQPAETAGIRTILPPPPLARRLCYD